MIEALATRRASAAPHAVVIAGAFLVGALLAIRPALGAAVLGAVVFMALVMTSLPAGVAAWIAAVFAILGLATTGMQLVLAAAWLGLLIARPGTIRHLLPGQAFLVGALALLLAWLSLSVMWAADADMAWRELRWWLVAAGALIVVATAIRSPAHLRLVLAGFVAGALLSVAIGALGLAPHVAVSMSDLKGGTAPSSRFAGAEGNPNDLAVQLLGPIVFACVLVAERRRRIVRVALAAAVLILIVALAATESRGGLLAFGAILLAAPVVFTRHRRRAVAAMAVAAAVAGAGLALSPHGLDRVTSFSDQGGGRATLWTVAWRMAKDTTPVGVGLNNFRTVAPDYVLRPGPLSYVEQIDAPHVVHDTYLELLAETGIVGLGLFLAVVAACLAAARRAAHVFERLGRADLARLARGVLLAGIGVLAGQAFQSGAYDLRFWALYALGPALLAIASGQLASARRS